METTAGFYLNDDDRKDPKIRRAVNVGRVYTDNARCDRCGDQLEGRSGTCSACGSLLCTNCIGGDGRCEDCSGSGREDLPED
jgi:hypothetical protein